MCRSADDPYAQGGPEYEYEKKLADDELAESEYRSWCLGQENDEAIVREFWDKEQAPDP